VVLDPGHGGKDPGAIGIGGVREKDVNLRLSKMLARRLRARSFDVVMTRDDDRFIDLEGRTVIAESSDGDVFVSIHSNASHNKRLRGPSTKRASVTRSATCAAAPTDTPWSTPTW
jgi:N-acetylmuramoyl-L-alanine amidase